MIIYTTIFLLSQNNCESKPFRTAESHSTVSTTTLHISLSLVTHSSNSWAHYVFCTIGSWLVDQLTMDESRNHNLLLNIKESFHNQCYTCTVNIKITKILVSEISLLLRFVSYCCLDGYGAVTICLDKSLSETEIMQKLQL